MIEFLDGRVILYPGNCLDVLAALPENSVDAVCCDPPYHLTSIVNRLGATGEAKSESDSHVRRAQDRKEAYGRMMTGFMGKAWDGGDIAFQVDTWKAVLRVLKPGGYILAFASTRGFWRMCVAIEDAGFITHPMIAWVFGSGFPKATRLKAEGYDGWRYGGQALKPAIEPIYMGQKPFSEKTGTANVLKHGTGAINVDACRISGAGDVKPRGSSKLDTDMNEGWARPWMEDKERVKAKHDEAIERANRLGRWPANLIHDGSEEVLAAFPESESGVAVQRNGGGQKIGGGGIYQGSDGLTRDDIGYADSGSAARFFASFPNDTRGREVECEGSSLDQQPVNADLDGSNPSGYRLFYSSKADAEDRIGSKHPTVKPIDLMRYLCRLITPPGGTVLDPFAGTGTTGEAAWREGFNAVLIEREPEYQADIAERMRLCLAGPDEKRREIIKRRGLVEDDAGPLFGGAL